MLTNVNHLSKVLKNIYNFVYLLYIHTYDDILVKI